MSTAMAEPKRQSGWPGSAAGGGAASSGAASTSAASTRASAFVAEREKHAEQLGRELGPLIDDPAAVGAALDRAFIALADPEYQDGQHCVAPGLGPTHGVRTPLQVAVRKGFERAVRGASTSEILQVCDRLLREPNIEARWFAITLLQRTLAKEPERTWQLLRRAAQDADDWITVDNLAHPFGKGILAEPYRWAELEQLTVSPSRWERRLVGSTIATMPFVNRTAGRAPEVAEIALPILATLIGDAEPDVQKALSWAYRSMTVVDREQTSEALETEARIAKETDDGHRAWVIRDSLSKLDEGSADRIRELLAGIRRRAAAPSTSVAAGLAAQFQDMGLGRRMPEPPLS